MAKSVDGGEVRLQPLSAVNFRGGRPLSVQILSVAIASVLVAAGSALAVAFPLIRSASVDQARVVLGQQADTLQSVLLRGGNGNGNGPGGIWSDDPDEGDDDSPRPDRGREHLGPDVVVVPVVTGTVVTWPLNEEDVEAVTTGGNVTGIRGGSDGSYFVEGRPLTTGIGFFLVQPNTAAEAPANALLARMALALLLGLGIAIAIALFVANRTARPLRAAANAANELSHGNREVDVEVGGPREVAEIGHALNQLAGNLAASEDRQREFLMSVSHELRTPMTALKGYAEALADGVIEPGEQEQVGALMMSEAARLDRLVADLLDLARAQAVEFRLATVPTDLGQVAIAAAEAWRRRCQQEGLELEADISQELPLVMVDPTRVRQILDNLLENAVRVVPAGGRIRLAANADDAGVLLQVDDNGPGLSEADLPVAFQPAVLHSRYRGERAVGTGLGLALVGKLAERMGGQARAAHSPMGGARFEVEFPANLGN